MSTPAARRWAPIVHRARQSGLSIREYARQNDLNERTLAWWNWRIGAAKEVDFVEVTVADPRRPLRLHFGRVQVDVERDSDLALLRQVVEALS